jgi:hypothetical protein
VAEALTGKPTPSYSATRKKRTGETWGGFTMAATPVTRRPILPEVVFHAGLFLQETLDWLHLWNWNHAPPDTQLDHFDYGGQHCITLEL